MNNQTIFLLASRLTTSGVVALVGVSICHMVVSDSYEIPPEAYAIPLGILIAALAYGLCHPELLRQATTPDGTEMPWINPATGKEMPGGPEGIDSGGDTYGRDSHRHQPWR